MYDAYPTPYGDVMRLRSSQLWQRSPIAISTGTLVISEGHVEGEEDHFQTARRELKEETGINEVEIDSGWSHRTEYTFQKKGKPVEKQVFWYIASTNQLEVKLSHEHTNYLWLSFDDAEDQLTFEQEKSLLREARAYLNPAN